MGKEIDFWRKLKIVAYKDVTSILKLEIEEDLKQSFQLLQNSCNIALEES